MTMVTRKAVPRTLEEYLVLPYTTRIIPDPSGGFVGVVEELPGCITQGETWAEVGEMVRDAMAAWISSALDDGAPVPVPRDVAAPSKILLRLPYSLHQELHRAAEREGVSLNQFLLYTLTRAVEASLPAGTSHAPRDKTTNGRLLMIEGTRPTTRVKYVRERDART